jgi:hypothetical protein
VSTEHHVTREDLFAAVWERLLTKVAADYGISDVALKKICKKMEIPTPGVAYWRRLECGHPASVPKLPPLSDDGVDSVVIHPPLESRSVEVMEGVTSDAEIAAALAKVASVDLHPLLAAVNHSLQAARTDERGLLARAPPSPIATHSSCQTRSQRPFEACSSLHARRRRSVWPTTSEPASGRGAAPL